MRHSPPMRRTSSRYLCHDCSDQLDDAANAVFALIDAGNSTRPNRPPTTCWRASPTCMTATSALVGSIKPKATTARPPTAIGRSSPFARNEPHLYDPDFVNHFQSLIDRLEPQAAAVS